MSWTERVSSAARALMGKGSVVATATTREGWSAYGIPADSGDGFAYNRDGIRWGYLSAEQRILQLATAMACVRLLSQTIATLPVGIYRRMPDGSRKAEPEHGLYEILHNQPNPDMTAVDFWQMMLAWMLLRGTAYAEKDMIGPRLVGLTPLYIPALSIAKNANGTKRYTYTDPDTKKPRDIPESKLWKLPAFTLNGEEGISPICYGANVFGNAMAADQASRSVFENGLSASGFIQYGETPRDWLTPEQRSDIRRSTTEFSGSSRAGKTMVLEGGMKYAALSMNPEDAQMLETRSFNIEEICRWFGVPPTLIGHGDKTSNWGTGLEQQNLAFLTYSLRPWLAKIEQGIRRGLISAADKASIYAEFSVEGLLRADTTARAAYYTSALSNGYINRATVAKLENLPIPEGGEIYTVQAAMIPLDSLAARSASNVSATGPNVPEDASVQETALNGTQITSLQSLLQAAADGTMPVETVRAAIGSAFPLLTTEEINAMIVPLTGFTPKAPKTTAAPFEEPTP